MFAVLCAGLYAQQARVAVAPFTAISGNAASDAETIAEIFGLELQAKNVVRVYTRGNTLAVMNEHRFQMSDLSSDEKTASIGKAASADWVVRGSVQKLGTRIVVTASLLDVNTLEIMAGAPMYLSNIEEAETKMSEFITTITQRIAGGSGGKALSGAGGKVYKIGDFGPAGGIIFYDKGLVSNGWRYLEAAPRQAEFESEWGADEKEIGGTDTRIGFGKKNTEIIVAFLKRIGETNKAAQLCDELDIRGYDDWFLPSKDELYSMYLVLDDLENINYENRMEYLNGTYWSSSEYDKDETWKCLQYDGGRQITHSKHWEDRVRAVRAF
jgi:TolB-like protein